MSRCAQYAVWSVMAVVLALICVSEALAKPESVVAGTMKAWRAKGTVVEVRKQLDDKTYDIVLLKGDEIKMYRLVPGEPPKELKPAKKYNIEKIKALGAKVKDPAERSNYIVAQNATLASKHPIIRAITLNETEDGKLEFYVHCYHPADGSYRLTQVVDAETWTMGKDAITPGDPRAEVWCVEDGGTAPEPTTPTATTAKGTETKPAAKNEGEGAVKKDEGAAKKDAGAAKTGESAGSGKGQARDRDTSSKEKPKDDE